MTSRVAIIGLGPTGVFAAKAAFDAGCQVDVFTYGNNAVVPGPFWFHWIPDDLQHKVAPTAIYSMGKGKELLYRKLQWGEPFINMVGKTSFPEKDEYIWGYNPRRLMDDMVPNGVDVNPLAFPMSDVDVADLAKGYDKVFQTFPTKYHKTTMPQPLYYFMASRYKTEDPNQNYVIHNGTGEGIVVREANLFGHKYLEFPKQLAIEKIRKVMNLDGYVVTRLTDLHPSTKPIMQDMDNKVILIGRWAEWNKQRLSHEIYSIVYGLLK